MPRSFASLRACPELEDVARSNGADPSLRSEPALSRKVALDQTRADPLYGPGTWVTFQTGHMGNSFRLFSGAHGSGTEVGRVEGIWQQSRESPSGKHLRASSTSSSEWPRSRASGSFAQLIPSQVSPMSPVQSVTHVPGLYPPSSSGQALSEAKDLLPLFRATPSSSGQAPSEAR